MPDLSAVPSFSFKRKHLIYAGVVVVLVGGFFLLRNGKVQEVETHTAMRSDFLQEVSVSGKVLASDDVELGFSGSGRIERVLVKAGDDVEAGELLASLENSDARAEVLQKRAALDVEEAKLATLEEGTRPEEISVTESTIASNEVALSQSYQGIVDAIRNAYNKSDDAIHNQLDQFIDSPRSPSPQLEFLVSDGALENQLEIDRTAMEPLLANWQSANASLSAAESAVMAAGEAYTRLGEVQNILSLAARALVRAVPSGAITQSVLDGYATDIASARSSLDTALSALTTSVTSARAAETTLAVSKKNLALQLAGTTASDIAAQEAQMKVAEAHLANAEAQLAKTYVRAPFAGIVTSVDIVRGEIVAPNTPVISLIAPETLQVESYVPESQIGLVELGDRGTIVLDALPGDVVAVSVGSVDPAATVRDGVSTYRTILLLDDGTERIKSGMTGDVVIITDERRGVLSIPMRLVFMKDGREYVRVQMGESSREQEVRTGGVSALGTIEIVSGLSEGDVLLLSAVAE